MSILLFRSEREREALIPLKRTLSQEICQRPLGNPSGRVRLAGALTTPRLAQRLGGGDGLRGRVCERFGNEFGRGGAQETRSRGSLVRNQNRIIFLWKKPVCRMIGFNKAADYTEVAERQQK